MAQVLDPVDFSDLRGFADDDCLAAFHAFVRSAKALVEGPAPTRPAVGATAAQSAIARQALSTEISDEAGARDFFERCFQPYRLRSDPPAAAGFLTGYYEPRLLGSRIGNSEFTGPVLGRPDDLVAFTETARPASFDPVLSGARRLPDGALAPYPERAVIEAQIDAGEVRPILWLRDPVEVFLAQVQGSASVELDDGSLVRLAYDGRNGQPYTSIGRRLIESGEIAESDMSLARLKQWLRANGLAQGDKARNLMQANRSYVFFKVETQFDPSDGPTGGAGVGLTALRSIAIDRTIWAYGTPFWLDANLPWRSSESSPFRRLTIAQDTGSAILGPARADLYFGGGDDAGRRAGDIRHACDFTVLLPREAAW